MKIISGGQTGVDIAALKAALDNNVSTGGWCPPGRRNENGIIPEIYSLRETPNESSPTAPTIARSQRTEWNVRDSEATLLLIPANYTDSGIKWTLQCINNYKKPFLNCDPFKAGIENKIIDWIKPLSTNTINIAGPGESNYPGIYEKANSLINQVLISLFGLNRTNN